MKITEPELKVVRFSNEDVIATSLYAFAKVDGSYDIYEGTMGAYDEIAGAWSVNLVLESCRNITAEEFNNYSTNISNPDRYSLYGAYLDGNKYFTKGATYVELYNESANVGGADPVNTPGTNPPFPMP